MHRRPSAPHIGEIIGLGDATSTSAVIVDDADLQAVESFVWEPAAAEPPTTIEAAADTTSGG